MRGTISHEHPQEVTPDLSFHTDPEEIEEEEQAAAEKAVTKERFQVTGLLQLPRSLLLNLSPDWPEGTGALGAYSAIPYLKAECLAHH